MKSFSFLNIILLILFPASAQKTDLSDTNRIKTHLIQLTQTETFRTYKNVEQLNRTAEYIHFVFKNYCDSVQFQEYDVDGVIYKNVICSFGTENPQRLIVGAHYDVCGNQAGADDNASGVTGLLELSRLLSGRKLKYRIDLVAYTLEEPPYFLSPNMGSYVHARSLVENNVNVFGMISLEMIACFKDEKGSQSYPMKILSLFYGKKGNYITLVKKFNSGKFARKFFRKYKRKKTVRTKKFTGPSSIQGVDYSDHRNYWSFGISALMITDTSFYRNKNYHRSTDTMETLDIQRMGGVIDGVLLTLISF